MVPETTSDYYDDPATQESLLERAPHAVDEPTHIVGIGASAGGLEALERFFEAMPSSSGMAFVVVQHLSPDFKSLMDELLSHRTTMAIHRVEDGMPVARDAIYLIPPKKEMIISGGRLLLTDKDPNQALTLPIDRFFRSLAQDAGRNAIAIVLSGTGSDGSRGVPAVHDAGGLVIVQSESSAKFDGMPKSAIDTGVVDLVLRPEAMPEAILRHADHPFAAAMTAEAPGSENGAGNMPRLFEMLLHAHGIDFSQYKPSTVGRRIERRLLMRRDLDLDEYVARLADDPIELNSLYKDLLIGVTKFFRDPDAFRLLDAKVVGELVERTPPQGELRIWVAGCGTGEEAYSLAILVREQMRRQKTTASVKIFATDVHRTSIDFASAGIYSAESLSEMDHELVERYFLPSGEGYQVVPELRQMIVFAHHNIIKDAPFTKLDLISCRNLLIYFQPAAQKKAVSLFHFGLRTGGVLFLGPSESPAELSDEFEAIDQHWKVYRKRRDIRLSADLRLPLSAGTPRLHATSLPDVPLSRGWDHRMHKVYDALLDEFMPPSLLIDERRELLHTFGGVERFLKLKGGRTSTHVADLVEAELRIALTSAVNRVENEESEATFHGIRLKNGTRLSLSARPIRNRHTNTAYVLIVLTEEEPATMETGDSDSAAIDMNRASRDRVETLESQLRYAEENLQATVEELETSNEELQASNEELVASNEELQSTNEELHSVNEELYTVNAEYQRKIQELTELNNDMDNLLVSTEIGTIFLDAELRLRKYTPEISRVFNLLPQDVGRKIDAFAHTIDEPQLIEKIQQVIRSATPLEKEVQDRQGNHYLLRLLPYRESAEEVNGAVLTLIDVSALKLARSELQLVNRQLRAILDNSTAFIYVKDLDGRYLLCNGMSRRILGAEPDEVIGKTDYEFLPTEIADVIQQHDHRAAAENAVAQFEEVFQLQEGERTYLCNKFPLRNDHHEIYGVGAVCTDITERKKTSDLERLRVVRRDQFLAMLSHELRNPLGAIINATRILNRMTDADMIEEAKRVIDRQSHHMSRLLDDLLDVSRVTQGKIAMRRDVIDLRMTTRDAVDAVRSLVERRRQRFSVDIPEEPVYVEADPARLQQLQVNLLTNASKYNTDEGEIELAVEATESAATIVVKDNGFGIADEKREEIFDLFMQSDSSRSDGGMGVGLTLARSIVEKHGGKIAVHSDGPGRGSEFRVTLPLTGKRPDRSSTTPSKAEELPPKILIVEDNADARRTLEQLLTLDGCEVLTAADGDTALKMVETCRPEAALIDIGLPVMNGYELARRIRDQKECREMQLIALTGFGQANDREAAIAAGFDAHLVKPVDWDALKRLLAENQQRSVK